MEKSMIIKIAKILNYIEVLVTALVFMFLNTTNLLSKNSTTQEAYGKIVFSQIVVCLIMSAVSLLVITFSIILMTQNKKRIKTSALVMILASGIISFIFSYFGVMIGIIVFALSLASLRLLKKETVQDDAGKKLHNKLAIVQNNSSEYTDSDDVQVMNE